jgi:hypothetical protein
MADRIIHDPHFEVMPDHAGPHYDALRDALTQNGMTLEQAVQALDDSWTQNHEARIQAWDQQVLDEAAALNGLGQQPQQDDIPMVPPEPPQQHDEVADAEKKPKMKDFDDMTPVSNYIAPRC